MIKNSKGEKKLELLFNLTNYYQIGPELIDVSERVKKEAIKQNNKRYLAASYGLKARYFTSRNNLDSTIFYAELANNLYEKYDIENPNQTYYYIATVYINHGYYELGIFNIKKYLEVNKNIDSYIALASAYLSTGRYDLAKQTIQDIITNGLHLLKNKTSHLELILYNILTIANIYNQEYEEAIETCSMMEYYLNQKEEQIHPDLATYYKYHIYNLYANIYIKEGDQLEKAKKYLELAQQIPDSEYALNIRNETFSTLGEYYLLIKEYNKAINFIDIALDYYTKELPTNNVVTELIDLKVKAFESLGKHNEALQIQKAISQYRDSIYKINVPLQLLAISKDYEARLFDLEREKSENLQAKSKFIITVLIVICLLLFLVLYIIHKNSREQKKKNAVLLKKYTEIDHYAYLKENYLKMKGDDIITTTSQDPLFQEIEKYMKDEKAYKKEDLTREDIARDLKTNYKYVIEVIKTETGLAFLDYVNKYRLNYARKKLMEDINAPVNSILFNAGFSSSSTFYRLFKSEFGMTPNELRKAQKRLRKTK